MSQSQIKTDEKKQHFDDIYVAETPVPFKQRILDDLEYISDDFNRQTFDRLILPWVREKTAKGNSINYVDLCSCFGNTTMATVNGMDYESIRHNWRDEQACQTIESSRRFPVHTTAIDISENATRYGKNSGLFDDVIVADLNDPSEEQAKALESTMEKADVVISTASLVYLDTDAIKRLLDAFARRPGEGYMMVNFLNPFSLEKSDATKRLLLERLEFVGSTASRHRRLSPLEQENYPGEEWALLEIWVLRRKG
ncbi:MAG: class I SAM-dependent methyltransferase [Gammaproteobacteria bacterium]|nr:class I SAM-dependent methyltransferase [Gammaproteobacteria bacterium]